MGCSVLGKENVNYSNKACKTHNKYRVMLLLIGFEIQLLHRIESTARKKSTCTF